ncbi:MAG: cyclic-di-AMP receptor [Anaerolineales bacterium]|nr:cyclic-di-AMP receptor [Anaerolineales bacterium]
MNSNPIDLLMTAVVQVQDVDRAIRALQKIGLSATRMSSTGGFLGRRNITLLIGLSKGQEGEVVEALQKSCHRRVEYVATSLEGSPFHLPLSTPVMIGGATLFTFQVERFEEL